MYEDEKQDVTVIDNVKANVSVTHKGVIYTDMDNNIHLLDRAGTDTILYAYESQTGFLNYGNYDEGGIFVCSESDTGIDIYYITWDGMKNLLVHCNGARLGTDLWLSSGNDYYSYFRNGEFVISKKILYSDAY